MKSRKCLWIEGLVVRFDRDEERLNRPMRGGSVEERPKEDGMATATLSVNHSNSEHIESAVGKEQRAYTFKIAVSMALYACLFFVLAFCGPYVLPAIMLFSDAPLDGSPSCRKPVAPAERHGVGCHPSVFSWGYPFQPTGDASPCRCARVPGPECQGMGIRKGVASNPVPRGRPVDGPCAASQSRLGVKLGRGSRRSSWNRHALERRSMTR